MHRLKLIRFCSHRTQGVFGELYLDNKFLAYSVEQPWANNRPFHSCVPAGTYGLRKWHSQTYPKSMVLVNPDLNVFSEKQIDPTARYACLMHPANWAFNVQGCIGYGDSLGFGRKKWMITNSARTTQKVLATLYTESILYIDIEWGIPCEPVS